MKKSLLNTYLEQMQINTGVAPNTGPGLMAPVKHVTSSVAGGNVTNKKMAMDLCYEKYCAKVMSEVERKRSSKINTI